MEQTDPLTTLADVATRCQERHHTSDPVWPTGFKALDAHLGGGLRQGTLTLLTGPQGLGKSTFALQLARNSAVLGRPVLICSFEHDAEDLFAKLVSLEAGELDDADQVRLGQVRSAFDDGARSSQDLETRLEQVPCGPAGLERVRRYASLLVVHRATGRGSASTDLRESVRRIRREHGVAPLVVVDQLQKVRASGDGTDEERSVRAAEALKELAAEEDVTVIATVAPDRRGMEPGTRMRIHHMRAAAVLAHEADLVLVLNDKYDAVARHHLTYGTGNAERFHDWVVVSVEKNRYGADQVDVEFRQRLDQGRFEPDGQPVAEQLVDERIFAD